MVIVAIGVSLALFVFLTYKRGTPLLVAPLATVVLALLGGIHPTEALLTGYMGVAGTYVKDFFFIFLTGALFAHIMGKTGAAESMALGIVKVIGKKWVVPAVCIATGVLTYGGISLFIIFFIMYPMALKMHKEGNVSKLLMPAEIALGSFTFSMTTPGSPQVPNLIPTAFIGTPPTSGFLPGWFAGSLLCILGIAYLMWKSKRLAAKGIFFEADDELAAVTLDRKLPGFWISVLPSITIIILLNVVKLNIVWTMFAGILLSIILMWKYIPLKEWQQVINDGAMNCGIVLLNTAAVVGFAGGVMLLPQFPQIVETIKGMSMSPYLFVAVSTAILSSACASASGGLSVTYGALAETFSGLGISMELVHRVSVMAAGSIDTLPHCPAVINLLTVTKTAHKDVYFDIAMVTVVIPTIVVFGVLVPFVIFMY